MQQKKVKSLMEDYKQFAFTLLSVSAFLYIGSIIPDHGLGTGQKTMMMFATCGFLAGAFFCVKRSLKYKKQLDEMEES
ncbi:YrhC family protein [Bacillus swezeyi]|uniref:YrhC family protein n=1 Tax=Bacillus swezeyi TaxID=1925020 RepID=A0A1R1RJC3_9BACI|nr:YrhC family protein [Bacillus swezeyi]KAA6451206.1 hypothetical protein DX927_10370 [Bacillus swezeyi]KAA6481920.1 hypothetical protein DX928_01905 [Bacillus swezeyi]MEC1261363.1 YrhC family protein [Bacillus swezeyi]MED1739923.1 YrhC family protein [Bacillus swezeyi]MED2929164.1 YrhC family protein [Bacillus swezeyi]